MKKLKKLWQKSKKVARNVALTGLIAGSLVIPTKAFAPPTFHQLIYENYIDGQATITNPQTGDTVMAPIEDMGWCGHWAQAPPEWWNLQLGDTVKIKIKNPAGDSALTWRDVTSPTGGNLIWPLYFNSHEALSVKDVRNGPDSAYAKCFKKNGSDTLSGKFRVGWGYYDIYFNGSLLNLVNGDSIIIEARAPGKSGFTQGEIQHKFIDADTFPSFTLDTLDAALVTALWPDTIRQGSSFIPNLVAQNLGPLYETPWFYFQAGSWKDSLRKQLKPQSLDTILFTPCSLSQAGNIEVKAWLKLDYDFNFANDSLTKSIYVKPPFKDIALLNIIQPPDTVFKDSNYIPAVKIKNQSQVNDSAKIRCFIDSAGTYVFDDTAKLYLPAQVDSTVQFKPWTAGNGDSNNLYTISFINLLSDSNPANDRLSKQFYVISIVGIEEKENNLKLIKLYPTLCKGKLTLRNKLDQLKGIEAKIYNLAGTYINDIDLSKGYYDFTNKDGKKLGQGIYFIKIINDNKKKQIEKVIYLK